jgi:hypothetical protein
MTDIMAQPGLGLTAPSSRQDIVSALLNDYGNGFESPYGFSPVPALKELPPPPPASDDDEKPLPPGIMRGFQLRGKLIQSLQLPRLFSNFTSCLCCANETRYSSSESSAGRSDVQPTELCPL